MAIGTTYLGHVPESKTVSEALASLAAYGHFWGLKRDVAQQLYEEVHSWAGCPAVSILPSRPAGYWCGSVDPDERERFAQFAAKPKPARPPHIQALIRGLRTPGSPWVFGAAMATFDENIDLRKGIRPELYWFMAHHTWTVYTLPKGVVDTLIAELEKVQ